MTKKKRNDREKPLNGSEDAIDESLDDLAEAALSLPFGHDEPESGEIDADCSECLVFTAPERGEVKIKGYAGEPTSIVIPSFDKSGHKVVGIENWAFYGCASLKSVKIPSSVTSIGDYAFHNCSSLESIEIGSSVTSIGGCAFHSCSSLKSVKIPSSVTSIGGCAFHSCSSLESIEIGSSVTSIGDYAFSGCSSLESIAVDPSNLAYDSRCSCNAIIETETNKLIVGCESTKIPDSVTSIGDYAFDGCSSLKSIEIPGPVEFIGEQAFSGCHSLESIAVDPDNPIYDSRDNCNAIIETETNELISGCGSTVIPHSVEAIYKLAFYGCSSLKSIEIPGPVEFIG
ncbi:MAG: leucine-rich repeat domain-containing protein, partial [Bacilli bacterium]|nr:leucine-rich repeat domain-containing protein [Bacilli bacterium]